MAGEARRMARVMEGFVNEIHVERGGAVNPGEQKALIEGYHVERKDADQNQASENPALVLKNIEGFFHYRAIYSNHPSEASPAFPRFGPTPAAASVAYHSNSVKSDE
jgi:hypothetical protein